MIKKITALMGLAIMLQAVCIAGEVDLIKLNEKNWISLETENFNVITDAKEEKAFEIVRELENFKYFLGVVLGYKQLPLSQKVSVVAAENESTFRLTGIPDNYSGLFLQDRDYVIFARCDSFIYNSKGKRNPGRSSVFHELVHLFIHNSASALNFPPWYDEGIAQYLSTYTERNGKVIYGDTGELKIQFKSIIKSVWKHKKIDTEFLFKITRSDLDIFNTTKKHKKFLEKFYAHSFLVVHYMFKDADHRKRLPQFLSSLSEGVSIDESFTNAFDMTFSDLDRVLKNYLKSKYSNTSAFFPEQIEISFPEVKFEKHDITKREAMEFLYLKIYMLPEKLLGKGSLKRLNYDMENLYPGLVNSLKEQRSGITQ